MIDRNLLTTGIRLSGYSNSETLKRLYMSSAMIEPLDKFSNDGSDLTFVILSFNRVSFTIRLIDSIIRTIPEFKGRILIIDNGSSKDQIVILDKRLSQINTFAIDLIELGENKGVAGGRNEAMKYLKTSWFLSLDNDIYLIGNPLPGIKKAIDNLGVLFLNVPLLQSDSLTIDAFGGNLWVEPFEDSYYISGTSTFKQLYAHELPALDPFISTFIFGGASVINRKAFLENGGYDSNMFIGFEDTELSLRLFRKGIKIGNTTDFCFIHAHQAPKVKDDIEAEKVRFSSQIIKESGEYFRRKHGLIVWRKTVDDWIDDKFKELQIVELTDGNKQKEDFSGNKTEVKNDIDESRKTDLHFETLPDVEENSLNKIDEISLTVQNEGTAPKKLNYVIEELQKKLDSANFTIRAMESSKFWRIRNYWFRLRNRLGVSNDGYSVFNIKAFKTPVSEIRAQRENLEVNNYAGLIKEDIRRFKSDANVLVFIPFMVIGGAETAILQVLRGYRKNRINATLIVSARPGSGMGDTSVLFYDTCPDCYVLEDYNNLWGDADNWKHWKNLTIQLIKTRNISTILISNSSFAYLLLEEIRQFFPHIKVINPVYSTVGHMEDNIKYEKDIDLTVVENPLVEEFLIKDCLRIPAKVKRIENGVDIKVFKPVARKLHRINAHSLPSKKKIITFLGRLSYEKGPDIFIDIIDHLKEKNSFHFVLSGDGPMREEVIEKISHYGLSEIVTFTGYAKAKEVLAATDILVLSSRIDGRPNVVLESLSMGVPVIASKVGGLPWIISEENETGVCCTAGDIISFATEIERMIRDPARYQKISKASRRYAMQHLDVSIMQTAYVNICRS